MPDFKSLRAIFEATERTPPRRRRHNYNSLTNSFTSSDAEHNAPGSSPTDSKRQSQSSSGKSEPELKDSLMSGQVSAQCSSSDSLPTSTAANDHVSGISDSQSASTNYFSAADRMSWAVSTRDGASRAVVEAYPRAAEPWDYALYLMSGANGPGSDSGDESLEAGSARKSSVDAQSLGSAYEHPWAWSLAAPDRPLRVMNGYPASVEESKERSSSDEETDDDDDALGSYHDSGVATAEAVQYYWGSAEYIDVRRPGTAEAEEHYRGSAEYIDVGRPSTAEAIEYYHRPSQPIDDVHWSPSSQYSTAPSQPFCACDIPSPIPPPPSHHPQAASRLAASYQTLLSRAPSPEPTPPRRLPHTYRAARSFSFERPLTPTPFSSRAAPFVPPHDPAYAQHHPVSGRDLERNAAAVELRRTMWAEERRAVREDVDDMVARGAGGVEIRYDVPKEVGGEVKEAAVDVQEVAEKKTSGKEKKTKRLTWRTFFTLTHHNHQKKHPRPDTDTLLFVDAPDYIRTGRRRSFHQHPSPPPPPSPPAPSPPLPITPTLLPLPQIPSPPHDIPNIRHPRISHLGRSVPATSSPLRHGVCVGEVSNGERTVVGGRRRRRRLRKERKGRGDGRGKGKGGITAGEVVDLRERTRVVL